MASGAKARRSLRARMSAMQGGCCCYCGGPFREDNPWGDAYPTFEHIHDRSKGGPNVVTNLILACRGCNERAGREQWPEKFKRAKIRAANIIDLADLVVEHMELPPAYLKRAAGR